MRLLSTAAGALLVTALLVSCRDVVPTATIPATATPGTPGPQVTEVISGMLTSVNSRRRIINVMTQSGAVRVLSVALAARVTADGADTVLANLGQHIGSKVTAEYFAANGIATNIEVD